MRARDVVCEVHVLDCRIADYEVRSLIVLVEPLALTETIPASRFASDAYIWLVPITWEFAARKLKNALPLDAVFRS